MSQTSRHPGKNSLQAQRVDSVASALMALLIVFGALVMLLFVYWLTQTLTWTSGNIVIEQEQVAGRGDHAAGFERDIQPPGAEEVEVLNEPTLEETLEAVTDTATTVQASIESLDSNAVSTVAGAGRGDSRPPGPLGEGDDVVPRYERWELKFQAKNLKDYAVQLDFYQIELACIGGGNSQVDYASRLSGNSLKRSGTSQEENQRQRLYFMWRSEGPLKQFDQQLLTQAGISTTNRQLLKFIPKELEDKLAQVELAHASNNGRKTVREVAKTIFQSQPSGDGFEFVVSQQLYRSPRP
ncbi:MAG: hypothetical protein KF752_18850 [Pirellulaceae bacterium]|nr:hypothetical protein [Pirellulaceae bacterium]